MTAAPVLFVSNGHGEDAIAAEIVRQFGEAAEAYPLIGAGRAYDGVCGIVGPRASVPSEGWRNVKGSLARDVAGGGLGIIPPAVKFLKSQRYSGRRIVVVGDMVGIYLARFAGLRRVVYLDVYKTGFGSGYSRLDKWAMRGIVDVAFCRDAALVGSLVSGRIDARAAGNVMMDTIPYGDYDPAAHRRRPLAVTLLPGSRALTVESFSLQVAALRKLPPDLLPDLFCAVAGTVDIGDLALATGLKRLPPPSADTDDLGSLSDDRLVIRLARGRSMGNLIEASEFVLSQAGTATVQSLGLGRPAITFRNARDRKSRFAAENRLFDRARIVVEAEPEALASEIEGLLIDAPRRAELSAVGRERIGPPGAIAEILEAIRR